MADDKREEVMKLLEFVGLGDVGEQIQNIPESTANMIRYLDRAERAERLGLGTDLGTLYRHAAERDRDTSILQLRAAITKLDARISRDDWTQLVDRTNREFQDRDRLTVIDDVRSRFRLTLMEMDGVSADVAAETFALWEESLERMRAEGLEGAASLLRHRLDRGAEALQGPDMGRRPASPITVVQLICIGSSSALAVIAMIACWFSCFTCLGYAIIIWLAAMIALCLVGL